MSIGSHHSHISIMVLFPIDSQFAMDCYLPQLLLIPPRLQNQFVTCHSRSHDESFASMSSISYRSPKELDLNDLAASKSAEAGSTSGL